MVHAENHDAIAWLTEDLLRRGLTAPKHHPASRPPVVEREATARILALAELAEAEVLIVHVSCAGALEEIRRARGRGVRAHAETCPQYLLLTAADLDRPGFEGAKLMCSPPPRAAEDQEALWRGIVDGGIDVFASDHAPYRYDDPQGKKAHGEQAPFTKVANGVPGLETRLPILFSEGVVRRGLDLRRFVDLAATAPARLYGLYPQKGTIAVASDADLSIWDPERKTTITADDLHDAMDYTPYEGLEVTGSPMVTISRGELVWAEGQVRGRPGRGRLCERSPVRDRGAGRPAADADPR
jgi:dihydropyrimidinase